MQDISLLDKNFALAVPTDKENTVYYDAKNKPISLYGVWHDGVGYRRLPADIAHATSESVEQLCKQTAGGRVRFITDSPYIIVKAKIGAVRMPHMPASGRSGFDIYVREDNREIYKKTIIPPVATKDWYLGVYDIPGAKKERLFTVNFPLYDTVDEVLFGVEEGSAVLPAPEYSVKDPILFYGSSITQGGCASRPGSSYEALISRRYDADYINLGFSGSAKGERAVAEYIASLKLSMFVFDYDFNSPTFEHYEATFEPFYKIIREKHRDLPIVFLTRPKYYYDSGSTKRLNLQREVYERARVSGDNNLYMIPGYELMEICKNEGTVDGTHPTDLGFFSMATRLYKLLDNLFEVKSD